MDESTSPPSPPPLASSRGYERILKRHLGPWLNIFDPQGDAAVRLTSEDLSLQRSANHASILVPPPDPSLTAFAQIVALRLRCERVFISLIGRYTQHVLAEATQTTTLPPLPYDRTEEALWFGHSVFPASATVEGALVAKWRQEIREKSKGMEEEDGKQNRQIEASLLAPRLIANLSAEEDFQQLRFLSPKEMATSCIVVPIISISGHALGVISLYNDSPIATTTSDLRFLQHMAKTVSKYLSDLSTRQTQTRASRLVRGLALFMEGKSSLRQWYVDGGYRERTDLDQQYEGQAAAVDASATDLYGPQHHLLRSVQELHQDPPRKRRKSGSRTSSIPRTRDSQSQARSEINSANNVGNPHTSVFAIKTSAPVSRQGSRTPSVASAASDREEHSRTIEEQRKNLVTSEMSSLFSRASNLIREACSFDGVIMYDASNIQQPKAGDDAMSLPQDLDSAASASEGDVSTSDGSGAESPTRPWSARPRADGKCALLGFSVTAKSSVAGNMSSTHHRLLDQSALRKLIFRYQAGKVFEFRQGECVLSSEDVSQDSEAPSVEGLRGKKLQEYQRMKQIAGADVNYVVFFPVWDWYRNRWFAGIFAWTSVTKRIIDPMEELQYLKSFGNSIMNEMSRLDAATADRAKAKFISSVSHEIRSPVHGMLAGTELLQGVGLDPLSESLVATIDSCGKTLLDTINHLLEYSEINDSQARQQASSLRAPKTTWSSQQQWTSLPGEEEAIDPVLIAEEVLESVLLGLTSGKLFTDTNNLQSSGSQELSVYQYTRFPYILFDFDTTKPHRYFLSGGAWRRILLNLMSNALKFTTDGYVRLFLHFMDQEDDKHDDDRRGFLKLVVEDTGKGIGEEFLRHQLYTPFRQENILSPGTGLGLHLTRQIIHDLGGSLAVQSTSGKGTTFTAEIPLKQSSESMTEHDQGELRNSIREKTRGLSAALFESGFADNSDIQSAAHTKVLDGLEAVLKNWFHADVQRTKDLKNNQSSVILMTDVDFQIIVDKNSDAIEHDLCSNNSVFASRLIVLCYNLKYTVRARKTYPHIQFITPPFGTRSIARALAFFLSDPLPKKHPMAATPETDLSVVPSEHPRAPHSELSSTGRSSPTAETPLSPTNDTAPDQTDPHNGPKLLLVEDNDINMKFLEAFAKKNHMPYTCANNGLEAVNEYKSQKGAFDIVFMDISMPIMDGITATIAIRRHERENKLSKTYIVALTGVASETAQVDTYNAGVDIFVSKPAPLKRLKTIVNELMESKGTSAAPGSPT